MVEIRLEVEDARLSRRLVTRGSFWLLVSSVGLFGLLSISLGQDANWDLQNYHVYNAYAFLHHRLDLDIAPAQIQTYYNPLLDLPAYYLMRHVPPRWLGFALGGVQGINFCLVYLIAASILAEIATAPRVLLASASAAIGMFGAVGISELGTTFNDLTVSPFVLLPVLILVNSLPTRAGEAHKEKRYGALAFAGLVLGCGVGLKNTLAIYAIGATLACLWSWRSSGHAWKAFVYWGAGLLLGVLTTSGFWALELWRRFGNPVFPYFNRIFKSSYYGVDNFFDERFLPKTWLQTIAYPFYFTTGKTTALEVPFQDLRFAVLYVLCAIGLSRWIWQILRHDPTRSRQPGESCLSPSAQWLIVFCVSSYLVWQFMFSIYRYVAPLEQLIPLAIVAMLGLSLGGRRLVAATLLIFSVIAVTVRAPDWGRVPWGDSFLGITAPKIPQRERSLVVMTSLDPTAYVIPAFPASARFVRIQSNFFNPGKTNQMAKDILSLFAGYDGQFYLLTPLHALTDSARVLGYYKLVRDGPCSQINSRIGNPLLLCTLRRDA